MRVTICQNLGMVPVDVVTYLIARFATDSERSKVICSQVMQKGLRGRRTAIWATIGCMLFLAMILGKLLIPLVLRIL